MSGQSEPDPPRTLCRMCLLRGRKVWMCVGHQCTAEEVCNKCGGSRRRVVLRWDPALGWLTHADPCAVCTAEAKRAFGV